MSIREILRKDVVQVGRDAGGRLNLHYVIRSLSIIDCGGYFASGNQCEHGDFNSFNLLVVELDRLFSHTFVPLEVALIACIRLHQRVVWSPNRSCGCCLTHYGHLTTPRRRPPRTSSNTFQVAQSLEPVLSVLSPCQLLLSPFLRRLSLSLQYGTSQLLLPRHHLPRSSATSASSY